MAESGNANDDERRSHTPPEPDSGNWLSQGPKKQLDNSTFLELAVRLNLLSAEQIDAAVTTWEVKPEMSVADWCEEQEFISKEDRELIRSIAITLHDDQSLTRDSDHERVINSQSEMPKSWQQLNAGVLKSLESLREPDDATHTFQGQRSDKGRFQVLRPLAKGGLGELFIAKDTELNREVALKTIKKWNEHDPASQDRFMLEAEVTAKLEHPGIVPVYGFGYDENNCPYYAMRYVVGRTLKDQLQRFHESEQPMLAGDRAVEFRKYLRSFIDVCQAVSYGHSRGVLHRDLKPSNVVVGRFDQTFVVDWGLAKIAGRTPTDASTKHAEPAIVPSSDSSVSVTLDGQAIGTPAFMSPEQAAGLNDQLDCRTDVYGLGATLYFLLTGDTPFAAGNDILQRIQRGDFKSTLKLKPALPAALDAICNKAMALRPDDRYQAVEHLANDLERWMADEPVTVFPDRRVDRWRRAYRQNPRFYHLAASALLVATVGSAVAALLLSQKNVQLADFSQQIVEERDAAVMNYERRVTWHSS